MYSLIALDYRYLRNKSLAEDNVAYALRILYVFIQFNSD